MTLNLPEIYGGEQLIISTAQKDKESFYVATLGNGPKTIAEIEAEESAKQTTSSTKNTFVEKLLKNIRDRLPGNKNQANESQSEKLQNIKLRFFIITPIKLKQGVEGRYNEQGIEGKCNVAECMTDKSRAIASLACGLASKEEPEVIQ